MTKSLFDLRGRWALVTGSSRGLGFTIARGLAKAGAGILVNARSPDGVSKAVSKLTKAGLKARGYPFDVTDPEAVESAVDAIEKEAGPIDILVNNAGINKRAPMESMDAATWHEVLDTNLTSAFLVSKAVGRRMIGRKRGKIVNICSMLSEVGRPTVASYAAAKGGLKMLTKATAVEWAKHNIQANGIGPGYFRTQMTKPLYEDEKFSAWICSRTPAGRWGEPEELIGAAVFLASAASNFVNGQIIYVDGGMLASL